MGNSARLHRCPFWIIVSESRIAFGPFSKAMPLRSVVWMMPRRNRCLTLSAGVRKAGKARPPESRHRKFRWRRRVCVSTSILGADVAELAILDRGVDVTPEVVHQLRVADFCRVVDHAHGFGVPGAARTDLLVTRVGGPSRRYSRTPPRSRRAASRKSFSMHQKQPPAKIAVAAAGRHDSRCRSRGRSAWTAARDEGEGHREIGLQDGLMSSVPARFRPCATNFRATPLLQ
jgi:hypothetical protein